MNWKPSPFDNLATVTEAEGHAYEALRQPEYVERFEAATAGLPLWAMYGLGPHSMPILKDVLEMTKPERILEIGFGAGASSAMWLYLSPGVLVTSVDNTTDEQQLRAAVMLGERYKWRFEFFNEDSRTAIRNMVGRRFSLCFIDGDHSLEGVRNDIDLAGKLAIPWVLFDDWWPHYGPGVQGAVAEWPRLLPVKQWGNLMLMRWRTAPRQLTHTPI